MAESIEHNPVLIKLIVNLRSVKDASAIPPFSSLPEERHQIDGESLSIFTQDQESFAPVQTKTLGEFVKTEVCEIAYCSIP